MSWTNIFHSNHSSSPYPATHTSSSNSLSTSSSSPIFGGGESFDSSQSDRFSLFDSVTGNASLKIPGRNRSNSSSNRSPSPVHSSSRRHSYLLSFSTNKKSDGKYLNEEEFDPNNLNVHYLYDINRLDELEKQIIANPTTIPLDHEERTILHRAVSDHRNDVVKILLENEVDCNGIDMNYWTPLHSAAARCNWEAIPILIRNGASVLQATDSSSYVIHYLIDKSVRHFKELNDLEKLLFLKSMSMILAQLKRFEEATGLTLDVQNSSGLSALHIACTKGDEFLVEYLVANGANPSLLSKRGFTPLNLCPEIKKSEILPILNKPKDQYILCQKSDTQTENSQQQGENQNTHCWMDGDDNKPYTNTQNEKVKLSYLPSNNRMKGSEYTKEIMKFILQSIHLLKKPKQEQEQEQLKEQMESENSKNTRNRSNNNNNNNIENLNFNWNSEIEYLCLIKRELEDVESVIGNQFILPLITHLNRHSILINTLENEYERLQTVSAIRIQKVVRRWLFFQRVGHILKMIKKRKDPIKELYEKEKLYIQGLEYVLENFDDVISKTLPSDQSEFIKRELHLHELRIIHSAHIKFSTFLEPYKLGFADPVIISKLPNPECVSLPNLFRELTNLLQLYKAYVGTFNFSRALELTKQYPPLLHIYETFKKNNNQGLSVEAYLQKPIARTPLYQLLIKNIVEKTPEMSCKYKEMLEQYSRLVKTLDDINEYRRVIEQQSGVIRVNQSLHDIPLSLVIPSRVLLKEGVVTQLVKGKSRSLKIFLFNDIFLYALPYHSDWRYKGMFHVRRLVIYDVPPFDFEGVRKEGIFQIVHLAKGKATFKSLCLSEENANEKASWLIALKNAILALPAQTTKLQDDSTKEVVKDGSLLIFKSGNLFTVRGKKHYVVMRGSTIFYHPENSKSTEKIKLDKTTKLKYYPHEDKMFSLTEGTNPEVIFKCSNDTELKQWISAIQFAKEE